MNRSVGFLLKAVCLALTNTMIAINELGYSVFQCLTNGSKQCASHVFDVLFELAATLVKGQFYSLTSRLTLVDWRRPTMGGLMLLQDRTAMFAR